MSKTGGDCGSRTINLAKQGNSLHERKTKLLIFEKDKTPFVSRTPKCGASLPVGITTACSPKRIRVCTGADMKRTLPPVMCDCKPRIHITPWMVLCRGMWFGSKVLLAGGLVYWSYSIGLWGDASRTEELYVAIRGKVTGDDCPPSFAAQFDDKCTSPRIDRKLFSLSQTWNHLVSSIFNTFTELAKKLQSDDMEPCELNPPRKCCPEYSDED